MIITLTTNSCRVCLTADGVKNIHDFYYDDIDYGSIYEYCTGSSITNHTTISPLNICNACEKNLLEFYKFRKKCETSKSILEYVHNLEINKMVNNDKLESIQINVEDSPNGEVVFSVDSLMVEQLQEDNEIEEKFLDHPEFEIVELNENDESKLENAEMPAPSTRLSRSKTKANEDDDDDDKDGSDLNVSAKVRPVRKKGKPKLKLTEKEGRRELCQQCGKVVCSRGMRNHLLSHVEMKEEDKQYACEICGKKYKYSDALSKHKRVHSNDMRYECQYCNKKFMIWATRRRHIDKEHTGLKRFNCNVCDAQFFDNSSRAKHLRVQHLGERRYECNVCQKKFIDGHARNLHMVIHTNEKKHVCEICNKRFGRINGLKVHRMIHSGEKNYMCPVCNRAFIQNHLLRSHVLKLHPEYELPPPGTIVSQKALQRMSEIDNGISVIVSNISSENQTKSD